jgi:phosphopantothenoylcysteine decarboxylase/phosphopantothenate--cysteine ligase
MRLILGVCGSISAYKAPWIVRELQRAGAEVRVVMTPDATRFVTALALQNVSRHPVLVDPYAPEHQHDGSWHVHWARWADRVVVAPCSANTLAKLAGGLADNALSLLLMSLPRSTPLRLAPAMDPDLWLHPATQRNVLRLQEDGVLLLPPEEGELASGLVGPGRLAEPGVLAQWALEGGTLQGRRVLVTAGPTREALDAVRYISNHSTGKMGYAVAAEARARGAEVVLISGPVSQAAPAGVTLVAVESAAEMFHACQQHYESCDVLIKTAAVADFAPMLVSSGKLKKEQLGEDWSIALRRTPDILAWLGDHRRPDQFLVGFALETDNAEDNARAKLDRKKCDLVVLNRANQPDSGFAGDRNTITLVSRTGLRALQPMSKRECARRLWEAIEKQMGG